MQGLTRYVVLLMAVGLFGVRSASAQPEQDVMLQIQEGQLVTGFADLDSGSFSLGQRVYERDFLSNNFAANPGWFSLETGRAELNPLSATGLPVGAGIDWNFLPMMAGTQMSNLLYWDGLDTNANGLDLDDVDFQPATQAEYKIFGEGGTIGTTGLDSEPIGGLLDVADSFDGSLHSHRIMQLASTGGAPAAGVYVIALENIVAGFDPTDPYFFVMRTATMSSEVLSLAGDWTSENIDTLLGNTLPGDFNQDGTVDAADYTTWRADNGTEADYLLWRANYGATSTQAAIAQQCRAVTIPEPAACWLVGMSLIAGAFVRGRNR